MRINPIVVIAAAVLFTAAGLHAGGPAYPLKVGPTGRYLTDRNGVPFLIHGDTPGPSLRNCPSPTRSCISTTAGKRDSIPSSST